jgi:hypothetical protein
LLQCLGAVGALTPSGLVPTGCCVPCSVEEAARKHPTADVFINYASFRRWAPAGPC